MDDDLAPMRMYLHERQLDFPPINPPLEKHQPKDVEILTTWMFEVVDHHDQKYQTFHLSCFYVTRYLSLASFPRSKLQLLSMGALLIASKMETNEDSMTTEMLVNLSANAFTVDQLIEMEAEMLREFDYVLANPTVYEFAEQYADLIGKSTDSRFKSVRENIVFTLLN